MKLTPEQFNAYHSPFDALIGAEVVEASGERCVVRLEVHSELLQPTGILHGGVHATLVETAASVGAKVALDGAGYAVGLSNHTDFLRPVTGGVLHAEATPVQIGRTLQLWQVAVHDDDGRIVASGRVRLMNRPMPDRHARGR